jgi:hypothetical protein
MIPHDNKVREAHLSRMACVYVRQSTLAQVQEHQESTRRQYELYQRARQPSASKYRAWRVRIAKAIAWSKWRL